MYKVDRENPVISQNGISYYVAKREYCDGERCFGIFATFGKDCSEHELKEDLFFTLSEAEACCKWLAKNEVYPITISEVLENVYHT